MPTTIGPSDGYTSNITMNADGSVTYLAVPTVPNPYLHPYPITLAPEAFQQYYVDVVIDRVARGDHSGGFYPLLAFAADVAIAQGRLEESHYRHWLATGKDMQLLAFKGFTPFDYDPTEDPHIPSPVRIVSSPQEFDLLGVNAADPLTMSLVTVVSHPPGKPQGFGTDSLAWMPPLFEESYDAPAMAADSQNYPGIELIGLPPAG